jgi:NADH-quinone oxidoreductase subunit N
LFYAVIKANYIWLAVIGVLNSVVSLFYYVKIIRNMFIRGVETTKEKLSYSPAAIIILIILVIPTLLFGVYFTPIVEWANKSVSIFLGMTY